MAEFVSVDVEADGVATIRFDRPKVNALDAQLAGELAEAGRRCAVDEDIRAVVLWGGPRIFAAGADIKEMATSGFTDQYGPNPLQEACAVLAAVPKVVIAAVNGFALGGGCELALTADFRYAGQSAVFGQPEILLGIIPGAGGTQRLPRLVGLAKAKELIYTGRQVDAAEALEIGLADRVVTDEAVYDEAVAAARRFAAGPYALRLAKQAVDDGWDLGLEQGLRLERSLFAAAFATEDQEIGMRSFVEQGPGKAHFTGH